MLDLGSISFFISPEGATAFRIPVVKRTMEGNKSDFACQIINTEWLFTVSQGLSFGNHRTLDVKEHEFEVMQTSSDYGGLIPDWYHHKHQAQGMTAGYWYVSNWGEKCFGHGLWWPDCNIPFDIQLGFRSDAIDIWACVPNIALVAFTLRWHNNQFLLHFNTQKLEHFPSNNGCDHCISLKIQSNTY